MHCMPLQACNVCLYAYRLPNALTAHFRFLWLFIAVYEPESFQQKKCTFVNDAQLYSFFVNTREDVRGRFGYISGNFGLLQE